MSHNIGQLLIAAFVVKTSGILYDVPPLMVAGSITGFFIGIVTAGVAPYLKKAMD